MLRYGIPKYRLPREVLDAEIQRILDLGVEAEVQYAPVGRDVSLEQSAPRATRRCSSASARIAASRCGFPAKTPPNVLTGTEFLNRVNSGEDGSSWAARCW